MRVRCDVGRGDADAGHTRTQHSTAAAAAAASLGGSVKNGSGRRGGGGWAAVVERGRLDGRASSGGGGREGGCRRRRRRPCLTATLSGQVGEATGRRIILLRVPRQSRAEQSRPRQQHSDTGNSTAAQQRADRTDRTGQGQREGHARQRAVTKNYFCFVLHGHSEGQRAPMLEHVTCADRGQTVAGQGQGCEAGLACCARLQPPPRETPAGKTMPGSKGLRTDCDRTLTSILE